MKNANWSILTSLSGGILGALMYTAFLHSGGQTISSESINALPLILSVLSASIIWVLLSIAVSMVFFRVFKEDINKEFKINAIISSIPLSVIIIIPVFIMLYEKMAIVSLQVVGNVYLPFVKYVHLSIPGYFLITLFGLFVCSAIFVLAGRFIYKIYKRIPAMDNKFIVKILFFLFFTFYGTTTSYVTFVYPPTADEPHYLLLAQSIVKDFDVNLENDYVTDKTYKNFYPIPLEYENIHNTPDKDRNGIYSLHSIGLPVIISGIYLMGGRYGVQLLMCALTALLMSLFYVFLNQSNISKKNSFLAVILFGFSMPILINSSLVLTEIPAAIIIIYALYCLKNGCNKSILYFVGIALLPWLHSKYAIFSLIMVALYYYDIIKNKRVSLKKEVINIVIPLFSGVLFVIYYLVIYGQFAPFAVTSIYVSESFYFIFNFVHATKAFFAIFFDRNFGILPYNLLFIISLWGMIKAVKNREHILPLWFLIPYFSMFLVWSDWSGSITPMRQFVPVILIASFYAAYLMEKTEIIKTRFFRYISMYSLFIAFVMMVLPALRYSSGKNKVFEVIADKAPQILWFFPDFYDNITFSHYLTVVFFMAVLALYFKYGKGR